jgi:hypothetical protein
VETDAIRAAAEDNTTKNECPTVSLEGNGRLGSFIGTRIRWGIIIKIYEKRLFSNSSVRHGGTCS